MYNCHISNSIWSFQAFEAEMFNAAEHLPLPRRDGNKKNEPRRCRDGDFGNIWSFKSVTDLNQSYGL